MRRLAALAPVPMALALFTAPAVAAPGPGGDIPDLAIVTVSGTGRTTVLRSGEREFADLWQLLQPTYIGTERVPDAWFEDGRYPPVRIIVVWGMTGIGGWPQSNRPPGGDVALQRQDQLFLAGDGTPWVRSDPAPDVQDDDIRWHRAPRSVFADLNRTGLLGTVDDGAALDTGSAEDGAGRAGDTPVQGSGDVWWALPGLAVGFVTGVGGTLLIRRAAAGHEAGPPRDGPRQELIDL
ncbi:hypothetical protein [Streptomyces sp. GESEQ-35]|uniref:hypothetical protein n=1 Tax=Streptomyces sp. GESEQ-35 TaxID=2812657 RepID=UPI001FF10CFE|nr:hypothetical protein [Streptomyces sp. GESEQ-35]